MVKSGDNEDGGQHNLRAPGFRSDHKVCVRVGSLVSHEFRSMTEWTRGEQGLWDLTCIHKASDNSWWLTFYFEDDDAAMRFKLTFG